MENPGTQIKSLNKTAAIMSALKEVDGATTSTLAEHLDLTKSTVHHHLQTLLANELVVNDNGCYRLGLQFFEYGEYVRQENEIYEAAVPEIEKLAEETGEQANLLIEEHGRGYVLHRAYGEQAITIDTGTGAKVQLHNTALGKAILAHLSEDRVRKIIEQRGLEKSTENTITKPETLFEELKKVRSRGYATVEGERIPEVRAIAAPIIKREEVQGAVSVAGPRGRIQTDKFDEELSELVQRTADIISLDLTYSH